MTKHKYTIPPKTGFRRVSTLEAVPELEPAQFEADEESAMTRIRAETRAKGLVPAAEWKLDPAGDGEILIVWECSNHAEKGDRSNAICEIRRVVV